MKKILMLLVAVASATTAFAETGETPVAVAGRQEMSVSKSEAPLEAALEALRRSSCSVSEDVYGWNGSVTTVTTTYSCASCSGAEACAAASAANTAYISSHY